MTNRLPNIWTELSEVFFSPESLREKYTQLYGLLDRVCIEQTSGLPAHYNGLFTRLQALCRLKQHPLQAIDTMRWRARQVKLGAYEPDEVELLQDTKALCDALARFTNTKIPLKLRRALPDNVVPSALQLARNRKQKRQRFVAVRRDDHYIYARTADDPTADLLRIDYTLNEHTRQTAQYIDTDTVFNCVAFTVDQDDIYYPSILILEPDYLIDVSSLTACVRPYGSSPFNYLLRKFEPAPQSAAILLGHVANQMLDDVINHPQTTYTDSLRRTFRNHLLDFCTVPGINQHFFDESKRQFDHIQQTVQQLQVSETGAQLEPSFFCETLGLQGRFDLLANDRSKLVELKSGKWDEARQRVQHEHLLQMLLYKEILYYNLDIRQSDCIGYLFYSRYPYLLEQRSTQQMVQEVLTLRNRIVILERWLCEGRGREFLTRLTPDALRQNPNLNESYWQLYFRPTIEAVLNPIHNADPLLQDYFFTFLQFIQREQMMAKVGDNRIESTRSMASLWNADADLKRENGDLLAGMQFIETRQEGDLIVALCLKMDDTLPCQPNFRPGDTVILYEWTDHLDNATNQQIIRATLETVDDDIVWVQLRNPLHSSHFNIQYSIFNFHFSLEHDHIEATFRTLYSGLFALLQASPERRQLLLSQREPTPDDFQLIVGPPGTGKTSVTMRQIVETQYAEGKRLLLTAYTNRAVDEICEMLQHTGLDYIRIGKPLSCHERYRSHLLENIVKSFDKRTEIVRLLQDTRLYVGTVSSLSSHLNLLQVAPADLLIIDEASQLLEPQLLPLLCRHEGKFIMIGDHKQLPAVVMQTEQQSEVSSTLLRAIGLTNCRKSLFQRLMGWVAHRPDIVQTLTRQGRMHPHISAFASRQFYGGQLDVVPLPHQQEPLPYLFYTPDEALVATRRAAFIDVPTPTLSASQAKTNAAEAQAIVRLVLQLRHLHQANNIPFSASDQVGIIVPYRRQIAAVRRALQQAGVEGAAHLLIDTVERYQGSQKDFIIYGTTVSRRWELDQLSDIIVTNDGASVDRKLNVAVTRARRQFFLVGSRRLLGQNPLYAALIEFLEK